MARRSTREGSCGWGFWERKSECLDVLWVVVRRVVRRVRNWVGVSGEGKGKGDWMGGSLLRRWRGACLS